MKITTIKTSRTNQQTRKLVALAELMEEMKHDTRNEDISIMRNTLKRLSPEMIRGFFILSLCLQEFPRYKGDADYIGSTFPQDSSIFFQFAGLALIFFPSLLQVNIQLPRRLVMVLFVTPTISPTSDTFIVFSVFPFASQM